MGSPIPEVLPTWVTETVVGALTAAIIFLWREFTLRINKLEADVREERKRCDERIDAILDRVQEIQRELK